MFHTILTLIFQVYVYINSNKNKIDTKLINLN